MTMTSQLRSRLARLAATLRPGVSSWHDLKPAMDRVRERAPLSLETKLAEALGHPVDEDTRAKLAATESQHQLDADLIDRWERANGRDPVAEGERVLDELVRRLDRLADAQKQEQERRAAGIGDEQHQR